jgi:hypothetical protein
LAPAMNGLTKCLFLCGFTGLVACGGAPSDDSHASAASEQDWVVKSTFDKAFGIVQGVDYLPFQYKEDGCYARALYMSMELAAQGMESNALFAFARPGTELTVGDITWSYHVAPMLEVGSSAWKNVHMIIDPALSDQPLTQAQWVGKMGFPPGTPSAPQMLIVPGSDYAPYEAKNDLAHRNHDTPDFAHLPPFKTSDVQSACQVMFNYIALEPDAAQAAIQQKQTKLLTRSGALLDALRAGQKLDDDAVFSTVGCQQPIDP